MKNSLRTIHGEPRGKAHLVGIKGVGMAGLAQILKAWGYRITGSDTSEEFFTDGVLRKLKIQVRRGFRAQNIPRDADFVIASAAYHKTINNILNPEVAEAFKRSIPVFTYPEAMGELFNPSFGIAVCGTHGKSTTSALLGVTLEALGLDPKVLAGTMVKNWGTNARVPQNYAKGSASVQRRVPRQFSDLFVLEADEYREAFLHYRPHGVVLTNIEYDHPDYFKTPHAYKRSFEKFLRNIQPGGFLVACGDNATIRRIVAKSKINPFDKLRVDPELNRRVKNQKSPPRADPPPEEKIIFYGFATGNNLRITYYKLRADGMYFTLSLKKKSLGGFRVPLHGRHHVLNATAVVGVCLLLGQKPDRIRTALEKFRGTARRFEFLLPRGSSAEPRRTKRRTTRNTKTLRPYSLPALRPVIIDDYAHHPTEIRVTLRTTREVFPERDIWAVFQPHTYSRTRVLMKEFAQAFRDADSVYILETYASARERGDQALTKKLAHAVATYHQSVQYVPSIPAAVKALKQALQPTAYSPSAGSGSRAPSRDLQPVIITLGAGDVWKVGKAFIKRRKDKQGGFKFLAQHRSGTATKRRGRLPQRGKRHSTLSLAPLRGAAAS